MTERPPSPAEAALIGKRVRCITRDWGDFIGEEGIAEWDVQGSPYKPDHHWVIRREGTGGGFWAKTVELVDKEEKTVTDEVPPTPLERRAWALRWAKDAYPDGTDIDHMGVADWLLKAEETITYPIYHPPASEGTKAPEALPKRVEFRDSGEHTLVVESNDGADSDDEVATLYLDGGPGYLTALRAKRVIEVLQRAINRA